MDNKFLFKLKTTADNNNAKNIYCENFVTKRRPPKNVDEMWDKNPFFESVKLQTVNPKRRKITLNFFKFSTQLLSMPQSIF